MGGRSPQQSPLVVWHAGYFPTPRTFDLSSPWVTLVHGVSKGHWEAWFLGSYHPPWEGPLPGTPPHQRRRGSTLFLPSIPSHSQQAGMASLQPVGQSSLLNAGGPWHMLPLSLRDFSNVPAGVDGFGRQHKLLPTKAWWSRGVWRSASSIHSSLILCRS